MRFYLAEEGHVVNALPPQDVNGGAQSDVFSLEKHSHASIVVALGATSGTPTLKVQACDDFAPTNTEDLAFTYYAETDSGGDVLGSKQNASASGITVTSNDNTFYVIEIDAAELPEGKPNLRVTLSNPGASCLASVVAVLSGSRYAGGGDLTVLS